MIRPALLDVNVLVALFDADHVHHEIAHDWFADNRPAGWATCPITENGLVRVLTHPAYGSTIATVPAILQRFQAFCASGHHQFWPETISVADGALFVPAFIRGHRQLTDVYLLGVAHRNGGRLATFDRTVPVGAVRGADAESLAVIGPSGDEGAQPGS